MGKIHGKEGVVQIADNAVLEVTSWTLETSSNEASGQAMGDEFTTNLAGIKSQSGTIEGNFEADDATGQDLLVAGSTHDAKLFPMPDATDADYWGGNVLVNSVSLTTPSDDFVTVSFSFVNADSNGLTRQTVA